ncbi:hypothetical protein [Pontibacter qinzhouensis]|nr:hypothetical protein [Pontibacter qinzhouensis]
MKILQGASPSAATSGCNKYYSSYFRQPATTPPALFNGNQFMS